MDGGKCAFFGIAGVIVVLVAILGLYKSAEPEQTDPQQGLIRAQQPCGWFWCAKYDEQYSKINETNSRANLNNSQSVVNLAVATTTIMTGSAQATLTVSQANQNNANTENIKTDGAAGAIGGLWATTSSCFMGIIYCLGGLCLLYIGYEIFAAIFVKG